MLKRIARVYPAYLVGLLISVLVSILVHNLPDKFPLVLALDVTMLQSYFPSMAMDWYGGGAWSVSTEFFFYLVFPLLLPLLMKLTARSLFLLLLATLIASSLPGLYFAFHQHTVQFQTTYAFAPSRLPEFVCGVVLGLLVLRHNFRVPQKVTVVLMLVAALYLAKFGARLKGFTVHNFAVLPAIMALICVLSQPSPAVYFRWIASRPMQYLGRISFSFYIVQLPIMLLLDGLLKLHFISSTDYYLILPIFLANLALAAMLYELVEKKSHKYLSSRISRPMIPIGMLS